MGAVAQPRNRIGLMPAGDAWCVRADVCLMFSGKADAMRAARALAQLAQPSSLQVHSKAGRIQEERTYPRSSDPKRTKG